MQVEEKFDPAFAGARRGARRFSLHSNTDESMVRKSRGHLVSELPHSPSHVRT
jgi:hypothetical protein